MYAQELVMLVIYAAQLLLLFFQPQSQQLYQIIFPCDFHLPLLHLHVQLVNLLVSLTHAALYVFQFGHDGRDFGFEFGHGQFVVGDYGQDGVCSLIQLYYMRSFAFYFVNIPFELPFDYSFLILSFGCSLSLTIHDFL